MFHTPIETRFATASAAGQLMAFAGKPLPFPAAMDLCQERAAATEDCAALRFAAEARRSTSRRAFRPSFTGADWRTFSSFCVVRRLPANYRVLIPGRSERTLGFVVEGSLWQETAGASNSPKLLLPGTMLGEDALFSDGPGEFDIRTLEDTLLLELSLPRQKELTASCPAIAFELLRAAGGVIAACNRASGLRDDVATN